MPNTNQALTATLTEELEATRARLAQLETEARAERRELEKIIVRARGTGDVSTQALSARVENALRSALAPISVADLARELGAAAGPVQREVSRLARLPAAGRSPDDAPEARQVHNHGTDTDPRWAWVLGDETSTDELAEACERFLSRRAYTFAELTSLLGSSCGYETPRLRDANRPAARVLGWCDHRCGLHRRADRSISPSIVDGCPDRSDLRERR